MKIKQNNINSGKINNQFIEQMNNLKSSVQNSKSLKNKSINVAQEEVSFKIEQKENL